MKHVIFALATAGLLFASAPAFACGGDEKAESTTAQQHDEKKAHAGACDSDCACDKGKKADTQDEADTKKKKSEEPA